MGKDVKVDLLLASQSSRRRELLEQIGVQYHVVKVNVPEERAGDELPVAYVSRLAMEKCEAGYESYKNQFNCPVLGADTIVVLDDQVLEKPTSKQHAIKMLSTLSGTTHTVISAVAIKGVLGFEQTMCSTRVTFRKISSAEIEAYWQTGEPRDKAGAYGIQGYASVFVEHIEGSYSNVVGLPVFEVSEMLNKFNIPMWSASLQ